jgi:hypothetical protein
MAGLHLLDPTYQRFSNVLGLEFYSITIRYCTLAMIPCPFISCQRSRSASPGPPVSAWYPVQGGAQGRGKLGQSSMIAPQACNDRKKLFLR